MSRRKRVYKKVQRVDSRYGSPAVARLITTVMKRGKKSLAERIVYTAIDNVKPSLEVKSRRVGGSNYQVPVEVNPNRRLSLSIRWIVGYARARGDGKTMQEKLANEFLDASNLRGGAVKKREDTHRMAEANKAFAHYRW